MFLVCLATLMEKILLIYVGKDFLNSLMRSSCFKRQADHAEIQNMIIVY